MKNRKICYNTIVLVLCVMMGINTLYISAENTDEKVNENIISQQTEENEFDYSEYLKINNDCISNDTIEYDVSSELFSKDDVITKTFFVPEDTKYELELEYKCLDIHNQIVTLNIDGKVPFTEAFKLSFPMFFYDSTEKKLDENGNEFSPDQILYKNLVSSSARDYSGRYENNYCFYFKKGEHELSIKNVSGDMELHFIRLIKIEEYDSYNANSFDKKYDTSNVKEIVLEGEKPSLKNNRSLVPLSDISASLITPSSPWSSKINYIGGTNWERSGDSISWDFSVEKDGYYYLGFIYRQCYNLGSISYRSLKIDGKTPFKEAERIKFLYDSGWQYIDYSNDDKPYYFFLNKGEHSLTLTASAGEVSEIYHTMKQATNVMGNLYVDITKIVGETVDIYRSYELFNQIPNFNERLNNVKDELETVVNKLEKLQEKSSGSSVSLIRNATRVIQQMLDNPYTAHRYKSDFYDAYTNISSLMGEITNMPLDIDSIRIKGKDSNISEPSVSFFSGFIFNLKRFIASYIGDYKVKNDDEDALTIWVNWGRDQAQVLNNLVQDDFTRKYKINTNIKIVNATLIQAVLAGKGPDVLLQLTRTEPLNYAMRGALYDLNSFDDIDDVLKRFNYGAEIPYSYQSGLYALPDTQSFNMMFVRTDILNELQVEIPKTWDDLITLSNLLQRNNLDIYIPGLLIYPTLLVQNNLSLYKDDLTASTLTNEDQIKIFDTMTRWYTKYKLPVTADFYNRFRIGSTPIGISDYSLYTQLKAAAPEIDGRWTAVTMPGFKDENGNINSQSAGTGTGCAITKFSKHKEKAWEFLKWWTSSDIQIKYSSNLESAIGPLGRLTVSNLDAFSQMDWDDKMIDNILKQQNNTIEIPEVPGGYYTTRCITQAFWGVVEQGTPAMESLVKWGEVLDNEISRKRSEYIK